jgi:GcrA cell cycle regulator
MTSNFDWTDVAIGRLRSLWDEGHSTAEIGRRLGVSKNAIVGKAHRLDLPDRRSPIRRGSTPTPRLTPPQRSSLPSLPSLISTSTLVTAASPRTPDRRLSAATAPFVRSCGTRSAPCCWPMGDPGKPGFRFCEADGVPGRPYCTTHCMVAYVRTRKAA